MVKGPPCRSVAAEVIVNDIDDPNFGSEHVQLDVLLHGVGTVELPRDGAAGRGESGTADRG